MEETYHLEDKLYREVIRKSNKSVIERINQIEDEQNEYREYIETWIHEVKAPLTALYLMCENTSNLNEMRGELNKLENYIDLALFYARSDNVHKDYFIKQTDLELLATSIIRENKQLFIGNQFSVDVDIGEKLVYTDEKWLGFILKQILLNCVKYRSGSSNFIRIYTEPKKNAVCLIIEDNGIGIASHEVGRIFEKGFTGSNGRNSVMAKSTGIGLYLCRKLCGKMDIGIGVESVEGEYTKIILTFPVSDFYEI